jgi:hypothetical protein
VPDRTPNCTTSFGEIVSDEYDGTVVFSASSNLRPDINGGAVPLTWISTDDGSTVQQITFPPVPGVVSNGDTNVAFDSGGVAYHTVLVSPDIRISSLAPDGSPSWSAPRVIGAVHNATQDRPWLAANPRVPGQLFLTFVGFNSGRFAYSRGVGDPAASDEAWCPADNSGAGAYVLPSQSGCADQAGAPGCWVGADSDGEVWVSVAEDTGCTAQPTSEAVWRTIGIHHFTVPAPRRHHPILPPCLTHDEFRTRVGAPVACIYYVGAAFDPSTQCVAATPGEPCDLRHCGSQLSVARDTPGVVSVAFQAYRDTRSAGPCTSASAHCRADQMFLYREHSGRWCGASCTSALDIAQTTPPALPVMLVANTDSAQPLRQEDHILPAIAALDGLRFAMSWLDFRARPPDPVNFTLFAMEAALIDFHVRGNASPVLTSAPFGPLGAFHNSRHLDLFGRPMDTVYYGDFNQPGRARLHVHFGNTTTLSSTSDSIGFTQLASPFTGP